MEKRLMRNKLIIIICMVPLMMFWHWFEPAARKNRKGIKAYEDKKYQEALNEFLSAKGVNPESFELKSNTAAALFQMKEYQKALEEFKTIDLEKAKLSKSAFHYNLGNTFFRMEKFDKALEHYKESLKVDSKDIDAKKNFELALKKQKEQEQKKDQQKDKDKQQQDKEQQQQQQKKEEKHKQVMQYLNQNEQEKQKEKKRQIGVARKEKDW